MEITRETVNDWLSDSRRSRDWLANQCDTSLSNVGMWLNKKGEPREIPGDHKITIQRLMEEDAAKSQAAPPQNLVLEFSPADYQAIGEAALRAGELVPAWAKRTLNEAAHMDVIDIAARANLQVYENTTPFELPFFGAVAAGEPVEAPRDETLVVSRAYPPKHFIVEVNGSSMEPDFPDGSRWIIDGRDKFTPKADAVCVVSDGSGSYLKRWNKAARQFESINLAHKHILPAAEAKLQGYPVERLA